MRLNALLDTIPRTRFGHAAQSVPAFRTCGVVGYYLALVVALGGALIAGVSPLVMAVVAAVSAASFFVYVYGRKWITGRETLELLDQIWFAELCTAGALLVLGHPVLPYLDVLGVALCPFLAAGRFGCTLVGCCHGRPSAIGFVYGEDQVREGFPAHLAGIRLFPVPAIEAVGLLAIGLIGLVALPSAPPGYVFAWFLIAYAVLRFGTEGLRGDPRLHWLGLSKPRWMALAELGMGIWIVERSATGTGAPRTLLVLGLIGTLVLALVLRHRKDLRRILLAPPHLDQARQRITDAVREAAKIGGQLVSGETEQGLRFAVSHDRDGNGPALHLSLSVETAEPDLELLCDLAAGAVPTGWVPASAGYRRGVIHLVMRPDLGAPPLLATALYSHIVRQIQGADPSTGEIPAPAEQSTTAPSLFMGAQRRPVRIDGLHWIQAEGRSSGSDP